MSSRKKPTQNADYIPRHRDLGLGLYRKVYRRMWHDEKFVSLSPLLPSGQALWLWLVCGPETFTIPGTVKGTNHVLSAQLKWPLDAFMDAYAEANQLGMVVADFKAGLVWLPNGLKHNPPASLNVAKAWAKSFVDLPECSLKVRIHQDVVAYLDDFGDVYRMAYIGCLPDDIRYGSANPTRTRKQITGKGLTPQPPSPEGGEASQGPDGAGRDDSESPAPDLPFELRDERPGDAATAGRGRASTGCTVCGDKVPGVVFKRMGSGNALAAYCWGCEHLGYKNVWELPVPKVARRGDWQRFEWAFPEKKAMRKRERTKFELEAVDNTRKVLAAKDVKPSGKASEPENVCAGCDGEPKKPGLLFHEESTGVWTAGLCGTCGGSVLYASPPVFMGAPFEVASGNGWVKLAGTPGADPDRRAAFLEAVTQETRDRAKAALLAAQEPATAEPEPAATPEPQGEPGVESPTKPPV